MSIAQDVRIQELERRVTALEARLEPFVPDGMGMPETVATVDAAGREAMRARMAKARAARGKSKPPEAA